MKQDKQLISSELRMLKDRTIMDVVHEISSRPGQEDPFYVLDVGDIVQKVKNWRLKLPRVKPFYAVKCNDHPAVLEILATLGTGFDCASKGEMKKIVEMGVSPRRIIFAHPCKPISHIRCAAKYDIDLMTFDNEAELLKIKELMPNASLVIRIRCDALKAQCPLGVKFGVLPKDAPELVKFAKDLQLNVVGVSFHVGSGCGEPEVFLRAIKAAREVFDYAISIGFKPYLLDIGGGFPGHKGSSLDEIANCVNTALEDHFPDPAEVEVISEPGRYMVASAFTLCTQVVSKRKVDDFDGEEGFMYYINDGVYGSFNCVLYDHQEVTPNALNKTASSALLPCSIWGPTCDGLDQVVSKVNLPKLDLGDWMSWADMGAYTITAAGTFNGFPLATVHTVVQEHTYVFLCDLISRMEVQSEISCFGQIPRLLKLLDNHHEIDERKYSTLADI